MRLTKTVVLTVRSRDPTQGNFQEDDEIRIIGEHNEAVKTPHPQLADSCR
jgi:hypothetical protein